MSNTLFQLQKERFLQSFKAVFTNDTVASRWYRAPEVVLLDHNYNESIDIWGLGCIFAELIYCSTTYTVRQNYSNKNRVCFRGKSCYPLSPRDLDEGEEMYEDELD